jgi:hypothetical protein
MKALLIAGLAVALYGCFTPDSDTIAEEKLATAEQQIVVCSSSCDPPTYNGSPVACASNSYCYSDAGGAYCLDNSGNWASALCTPNIPCGNGVCDSGENPGNCPQDCQSCGNGACDYGETAWTCPSDCNFCGDGICSFGEDQWSCWTDCRPSCYPWQCPIEP